MSLAGLGSFRASLPASTHPTRAECLILPAVHDDDGLAILALDDPATFEGAAQGDLVRVLEVAADGQTRGEAGDLEFEVHEHAGDVGRGGFALEVGVGGDDDLGDRAIRETLHELTDAELVRADSVDGADSAAEHVVETTELAGALDSHDILRLFDDADGRG